MTPGGIVSVLMIGARIVRARIVSMRMISVRRRGGGRRTPPARALAPHESVCSPRAKIFSHAPHHSRNTCNIAPMFRDLPLAPRELKATPDVLERIYHASKLGLRGDSLALRASLLPAEFARLKLMDPMAEMAELKGRADAEGDLAGVLMDAAQAGDVKVALEVLKHRHDWVAKQSVQVDVNSQISVVAALEAANGRLQRGLAVEIEDAVDVTGKIPLARESLGEAV